MGDFYGTGSEVLAGFGPIMRNFFEAVFFKFTWPKKKKKKIKNIVESTLKSCIK